MEKRVSADVSDSVLNTIKFDLDCACYFYPMDIGIPQYTSYHSSKNLYIYMHIREAYEIHKLLSNDLAESFYSIIS